jgi:hypothetical protein
LVSASALKKFDLLNAQEFVTIANEKFTNAGAAPRANMDAAGTNTDWQSEVMIDNAQIQSHSLTLQGGSEKTTYFYVVKLFQPKGIIISNFNKAYRVRLNIDHEVNKYFKVGNNLSISRQEDWRSEQWH